jgi:hypothetical protein
MPHKWAWNHCTWMIFILSLLQMKYDVILNRFKVKLLQLLFEPVFLRISCTASHFNVYVVVYIRRQYYL